jgi:hypothetical protein
MKVGSMTTGVLTLALRAGAAGTNEVCGFLEKEMRMPEPVGKTRFLDAF